MLPSSYAIPFPQFLSWLFPTFICAIFRSSFARSISFYLTQDTGLPHSFTERMADDFPIPETQVLAVASHVGPASPDNLMDLTD
jgi:hypothetical protein